MPIRPATALALAAALASFVSLRVSAADCGGSGVSRQSVRATADLVRRYVAGAHVGSVDGLLQAVDTRLRALDADRATYTQRQLAGALNEALVPLADAHLEVRMAEAADRACRRLPVRLAWNTTGMWIQRGAPGLPSGTRIERVGPLTVAALEARLAGMLPHETTQWLRFHGARRLEREDLLQLLRLVDRHGRVTLEVVRADGRRGRETVTLTSPPPESRPWFGHRLYAAQGTGVFWFDRFEYDAALASDFERFLDEAERAGVTKVAIDIRGNPGGDSGVAVAMLDALTSRPYEAFSVEVRPSPELQASMPFLMPASLNPMLEQAGLPPIAANARTYTLAGPLVLAQLRSRVAARPLARRLDGRRLFLLTDGGTFSSGTLFAVLVRDGGLAKIVGEPAGNPASFNGTELNLDLPGTGHYLNLSTARLWRPAAGSPPFADLSPDIAVTPTAADAAAGVDRALDAVLNE